jgi:uncharacterized protein
MTIRNITPSEYQVILELNRISVNFLSPLDIDKLVKLLSEAKYHKVFLIEGKVAAFILAFDQKASYDSPNYLWFKERYSTFLYIDRIVVSDQHRRKGIADSLYNDIIEFAKTNNYPVLTCELDKIPPNPGSIHFHDKHKFVEVGTQWLYNGEKQVSLRERSIL